MMKIVSAKEVARLVKDNDSVMVGGFLGCGTAHKCIDALLAANTQNLTLIGNDTAMVSLSLAVKLKMSSPHILAQIKKQGV